jgi:hypothetical protein
VNVNWEDNGNVVTFSEKYVNRFEPSKSKGQMSDPLRLINTAWVGIVTK